MTDNTLRDQIAAIIRQYTDSLGTAWYAEQAQVAEIDALNAITAIIGDSPSERDEMPDGWPDRMEMLGELMDACGVPNDGTSPPRDLWARCIATVDALADHAIKLEGMKECGYVYPNGIVCAWPSHGGHLGTPDLLLLQDVDSLLTLMWHRHRSSIPESLAPEFNETMQRVLKVTR